MPKSEAPRPGLWTRQKSSKFARLGRTKKLGTRSTQSCKMPACSAPVTRPAPLSQPGHRPAKAACPRRRRPVVTAGSFACHATSMERNDIVPPPRSTRPAHLHFPPPRSPGSSSHRHTSSVSSDGLEEKGLFFTDFNYSLGHKSLLELVDIFGHGNARFRIRCL